MLETIGRRRSPSISIVFCPAAASTRARLAVTTDLPSPAFALVTTMLCGGLSTSTKRRLVRSWRSASAAGPVWDCTMPAEPSRSSSSDSGRIVRTLVPTRVSMSSTVRIRLSS